jgi:predicted outer membrane repeat protein
MNINLAVLVTTILLTGVAQAATFNVTRKDDPVPDGCKANDCSLREAVIAADDTAAKDTIVLPAGKYLIDLVGEFDNSEETGDLDISTDMIFMGAPSTIDGQDITRIMDIKSDANVSLKDLTLQNAYYQYNGGGIVIDGGSLTVNAVTFDSNTSGGLGGVIYARDDAIVNIDDCLFSNNTGGSGVAINISGDLTVRNTVFRGNNGPDPGDRGAVAYVFGGNGTNDALFENVRFDQNTATGGGGAIVFLGRKLRIDGLIATGNQSKNHGGVLFVSGTASAKTIEIVNAIFDGNTAADNGGAINFGGGVSDTLNIQHTSFVNNTASDWGGALTITGGQTEISNSTFSGNHTNDIGGGLHLFSANGLTVRHTTFSGNTANNAGDNLYIRDEASFGNNLIDGECYIFNPNEVTSLGGNVEGNGDTCNFDAGSDLVNQSNVQLGVQPLRENLGMTLTHELTPASVARGQGVTSICESVAIDQLFMSRPSECNSGAVESNSIFNDSFETIRAIAPD